MSNNSESVVTSLAQPDYKFTVSKELLSVLYIVGIIGSSLALLHLYRKQTFKNSKQSFMLKCLMMLELMGLLGMLSQMTIKNYADTKFYQSNIKFFCFMRVIGRFFGMSSGCVAFVMAIERYFALTKPFVYCKHFTNGLIKRLILMTWTSCAILTFAPAFGFGIFYDMNTKLCRRYRDAQEPLDIAYAFICFFTGTFLCIFMVLCNFSVTRIVYRSYRNMTLLTGSNSSTSSKSISLVTQDEIKFINMCNLLTTSFVLCWGTQMITIPIAFFVKDANQSSSIRIFYHIADFLLLIHFTCDPYIYVLLRTNYWIRFKSFLGRVLLKKQDEFAELPKVDPDHHL